MISSELRGYNGPGAVASGTKIALWFRDHYTELGVQHVIHRQHIWHVELSFF